MKISIIKSKIIKTKEITLAEITAFDGTIKFQFAEITTGKKSRVTDTFTVVYEIDLDNLSSNDLRDIEMEIHKGLKKFVKKDLFNLSENERNELKIMAESKVWEHRIYIG